MTIGENFKATGRNQLEEPKKEKRILEKQKKFLENIKKQKLEKILVELQNDAKKIFLKFQKLGRLKKIGRNRRENEDLRETREASRKP